MSLDEQPELEKLDRDVLAALPIFPLPDMVLFPGALLPLHIFEPRYCEMVRDALSSHNLVAMACRKEDEVKGMPPPAVAKVLGVGEIVASEALPDGRYNILLQGRARVRIVRELNTGKPYRTVYAEQLFEERLSDDVAPLRREESETALKALIEEVASRLDDEDALALRKTVREKVSLSLLTDRLAAVLVPAGAARQTLLETLNPWLRVDRLSREIAGLLSRMNPPSSLN